MSDASICPRTNQRVFAVSLAILLNIFFLKLFGFSESQTRFRVVTSLGVPSIGILRFDELNADQRKFVKSSPTLQQKLVTRISRRSLKNNAGDSENLAIDQVTESHAPTDNYLGAAVEEGASNEGRKLEKVSNYFDDPIMKNANIRRAINETVASLSENKKKELKPTLGKWRDFNKDVDFASIPECSDKENALKYNPPVIVGVKLAGIFAIPSLAHAAITGKCK